MKQLLGVSLLMVACALPLQAQGIEFSGGVNFAKLSGDDIGTAARNTGMKFGLDFVIPIGPLGLNLGADWSQKGVAQTIQAASAIVDLSYIELPLHFRLPIVSAGPARINLVLGPTVGINTGCDIKIDLAAATTCADAAQGGFNAKRLDWSGTGGLGFSFGLGGLVYAGVDLLYTMGFTSVDVLASDLKNRAFTLQSHIGFDVF